MVNYSAGITHHCWGSQMETKGHKIVQHDNHWPMICLHRSADPSLYHMKIIYDIMKLILVCTVPCQQLEPMASGNLFHIISPKELEQ